MIDPFSTHAHTHKTTLKCHLNSNPHSNNVAFNGNDVIYGHTTHPEAHV